MRVPRPGRESMLRSPPTAATRSPELVSPAPLVTTAGSKPVPSSSTEKRTRPSTCARRIVAPAPAAGVLGGVLEGLEQQK